MKPRRKYYRRSADYVPKVYDPVHLAYMAGIIDGEGCFFIGKLPKKEGDGYKTEHYRGLLKISSTTKCLIDWILKIFDGTETCQRRQVKPHTRHQTIYDWIATGDRLLDLCEQILPYLIVKKRHCEIMINFRKSYTARMGSNKISEESLAIREACLLEIRKINSRYHLHPLKQNDQLNDLALVTGSYATASKSIKEDL